MIQLNKKNNLSKKRNHSDALQCEPDKKYKLPKKHKLPDTMLVFRCEDGDCIPREIERKDRRRWMREHETREECRRHCIDFKGKIPSFIPFPGDSDPNNFSMSHDGKKLAVISTQGRDTGEGNIDHRGFAVIINLETQKVLEFRQWQTTTQSKIAFSPVDMTLAVSVLKEGTTKTFAPDETEGIFHNVIQIYDPVSQEFINALRFHTFDGDVESITWSPCGKKIIAHYKLHANRFRFFRPDVTLMWDLKTGKSREIKSSQGKRLTAVAWSPKEDCYAIGTDDGDVEVHNLDGSHRFTVDSHDDGRYIEKIAWTPDASRLVYMCIEDAIQSCVVIWKLRPDTHGTVDDKTEIAPNAFNYILDFDISRDGKHIILGYYFSDDKTNTESSAYCEVRDIDNEKIKTCQKCQKPPEHKIRQECQKCIIPPKHKIRQEWKIPWEDKCLCVAFSKIANYLIMLTPDGFHFVENKAAIFARNELERKFSRMCLARWPDRKPDQRHELGGMFPPEVIGNIFKFLEPDAERIHGI